MKVPQFFSLQGVSGKAVLVWQRIVVSRLTIAYFIFSFVHFTIQLGLQLRAFSVNASAARFFENVLVQGNATTNWMPIVRGSTISVCNWVSSNLDTDVETCKVVWSPQPENQNGQPRTLPVEAPAVPAPQVPTATSSTAAATSSLPTSTSSSIAPARTTLASVTSAIANAPAASSVPNAQESDSESSDSESDGESSDSEDEEEDDDDDDEVKVRSFVRRSFTSARVEEDGRVMVRIGNIKGQDDVLLNETCLESLNWPLSVIRNTKREDIVFVAFQIWVLGMSMVAIMNESIPHIAASLLTHVMATAWAVFQIIHTNNFRNKFNEVVTDGACKGTTSLLAGFWQARATAEIPSLAMHSVSLVVSGLLTWKLAKFFGWQTFKRVGASLMVNRMYKIVLSLSIAIQLSLFFMFVTVSLWIDQLMSGSIGDLASFTTLYKVSSFITLAVLVPWLWLGWTAVRKELRLPMFFFLFIAIVYMAGWGVMFFSTTFRWTFVTWRFFSIMAAASVMLTAMSLILGVICRFNFGKGLLKYLNPQDIVEEEQERSSIYKEKRDLESFAFPPQGLVPTFSSTYVATEKSEPPPFQYQYTIKPQPPAVFAPQSRDLYVANVNLPPTAITRNLTDVSPMARSNSNRSDRTHSSYRSYSSRSTDSRSNDHARNNSGGSQTKRWVIE